MLLRKTFSWSLAPWVIGPFIALASPMLLISHASQPYELVGTQGWGKHPVFLPSSTSPRINVLEVDAWKRSLDDGNLQPVANIPIARHEFIRPEHFSPELYRQQIEKLGTSYTRQRDILMYYGGLPTSQARHGLNFNAWSTDDLARLKILDGRPFIGLETTDAKALEWMAQRLHQAGYGPLNRIYVRICAEPSEMYYGSEDGTAKGKRHTPTAYVNYQHRFRVVGKTLRQFNIRYGLDFRVVFAGTNAEDFSRYIPPTNVIDDVGYDLYVTPENKDRSIHQILELQKRFPGKPLVIPEFGIATAGPGATPEWAQETLGELLMTLAHHPAGVAGITVFSVDAARRMPGRRWNWAWTPVMFEMLKEWESAPRRWNSEGYHRYDPLTYPIGRDILYINRPDLRIVYRKLATYKKPGMPLFLEVRLDLKNGRWVPHTRKMTFKLMEAHLVTPQIYDARIRKTKFAHQRLVSA